MVTKQILLEMGDPRMKLISEVMGNKTCTKILDYLSEHEATVSEVSLALHMPLNTVDYNVKKLVKAGLLVQVGKFWSVKGKRMPSYTVSHKKIVISPRRLTSKTFLAAFGITGVSALLLKQFTTSNLPATADTFSTLEESATLMMAKTADTALVSETISQTGFFAGLSGWSWFLLGAWFALVCYMVITIVIERSMK
jgi:DNA-binding transcriptional ArsR family regulator